MVRCGEEKRRCLVVCASVEQENRVQRMRRNQETGVWLEVCLLLANMREDLR